MFLGFDLNSQSYIQIMSNWKTTSDLFEGFIDKPRMSEKLLSKPPFKYLFDIIMETSKKTGFANGLYEGEEMKPDYYGEKKRKIDYLVKIISLLQVMSGQKVAANPQKIVAGMEPQQTNEMLQLLHKCATSGKSSDPYVKKVLGGEAAEEPAEVKQPEKKKIERPPSAAKTKKSQVQQGSKKTMQKEREPERVEPKEEEQAPVMQQKPKKKQEYSKKVQQLMDEGEEQVKKQKQQEKKQQVQEDNQNQISLGRVGKNKKMKAQGGQKIISNGGQLSQKELDLAKSMIQSICHNTAPLGKSIEFITDDIESMNREQQFWRKQYHSSKAKYQNQLKITEEALLPIYDKLGEIEHLIKDQKQKIQTAKAQIIKNDSTIKDLLMSVIATK